MGHKKRNIDLTWNQRIRKEKQKKIRLAEEKKKSDEFYNNVRPTFIQKIKKLLSIKK